VKSTRKRAACPKCGNEMVFVEKNTMSGEDIRTYHCGRCDTEHDLNFGTALWKLMSDANKLDSGK
jgi:ribosomal protein S27AE